jgi:hypothetical protein
MWGGALVAAALGGCAHEESARVETPVASAEMDTAVDVDRQNVAGSDVSGMELKTEGRFEHPKGNYQSPQGEFLKPEGVYGTKGKLIQEGQVVEQGSYGTWTKSEGTVHRPTGIRAEEEGTYYRPFGSDEISDERQPVAGRDIAYFFVKDAEGRSWQIADRELIRQAEQKLADQGCDPGSVDGKADEKFGPALMRCQSKLGMQPTGVIDQQTAEGLGLDWAQLQASARKLDKPRR